MGPDRGKRTNTAAPAPFAGGRGEPTPAVGHTTFRPPYTPVTLGAIVGADTGRHFEPIRRTPMHERHEVAGALFVEAGLWLRAQVYPRTGETMTEAIRREVNTVRAAGGLVDVSTLGKIDIQGPDAALFLDRVYTGRFSTLPVGRARYGLMLREDGIVFDDGTVARLGPQHFVLSTTTANAASVLEHLEFHHETAWPELDVALTGVSDQWAQFAVAGPMARSALTPLVGRDLSDAAFPFMAAGEAVVAGVAGRLYRISFSGELAYEVSVPAHHALPVWEAILDVGAPFGLRPYGLDALNLLRIEKGHVAGSELNGQTTARDLGLDRLQKKSGDYVGRVLAGRPGLLDEDRPALVGLRVLDGGAVKAGAHLVESGSPQTSLGFVTAACPATEDGHFLGLALLSKGRERLGQRLTAADPVRSHS